MKLRTKLSLGFFAMVLILSLVFLVTRFISKQVEKDLGLMSDILIPSAAQLESIYSSSLGLWEATSNRWYLARTSGQASDIERESEEYSESLKKLTQSTDNYRKLASLRYEEYPHLQELLSLISDLILTSANLFENASTSPLNTRDGELDLSKGESIVSHLEAVVGLARKLEIVNFKEKADNSQKSLQSSIRYAGYLLMLAFTLALALNFLLFSNMFTSIFALRSAASRVAKGDLSLKLEVNSRDEIAELVSDFNQMVSSLKQTTHRKDFVDNILNSIQDSVVLTDSAGSIIYSNLAASTLIGSDPGRKNLCEFFVGGDFSLHSTLTERRGLITAVGNEYIPVKYRISKSSNPGGSEKIISIRNVQEVEKLEAETKMIRAELQRTQHLASLGTIGAMLAHRLNQPLTVIRLLIQQTLRQQELSPDKLREALAEVESASEIVKDVLSFTRPVRERELGPLKLFEITSRIIRVVTESSSEVRTNFNIDGLKDVPELLGAEEEWNEIIYSLIENSIQAAPKDRASTISMQAALKDGILQLFVSDTCGGIAAEHLPHIFDIFYSTKPRGEGTGLGLAIVKQLITSRGGSISVESKLGKGTDFQISVPVSVLTNKI